MSPASRLNMTQSLMGKRETGPSSRWLMSWVLRPSSETCTPSTTLTGLYNLHASYATVGADYTRQTCNKSVYQMSPAPAKHTPV